MTKQELHRFQHHFKEIYDLPYVCKNGIRFADTGISMVTQYGIVFPSNGYLGNDRYYPILQHHETAGDGSTKYDVSVDVSAKRNSDLEILGGAIAANLKRNAEAILRKFS
jgi:hypothetical protein